MGSNEIWRQPSLLLIFVTTFLLLAMFLIANGIGAWYDERTRRALAIVRTGALLRSGFGTFHGIAQNLDARSGGELVRRDQLQVIATATGITWEVRKSVTRGCVFVLRLEDGAEIEVDAREARLVGFPESSPGAYTTNPFEAQRRDVTSRVSAGDEIWATGVLARPAKRGGGAYRAGVSRRTLGAPRRGEVELSRESPVVRWKVLAAAHKRGAYAALGAFALVHGVFFRAADRILLEAPSLDLQQSLSLLTAVALTRVVASALFVAAGVLWFVSVRRARNVNRT